MAEVALSSRVMAAAGPVFGELVAESEFLVGEPISAKGLPIRPLAAAGVITRR
ncbi:hypothetical protein [Nocardia sp. NPDC127526]|uniref:hypothetical protein n=1 Tax=Nocardia sp. NPDC127526 TaxID=3345393 RepID=UPI0036334D58